jgi:tubulin polyglutamylase TTLL6/13
MYKIPHNVPVEPVLLEVNHTPSFNTDTPLDTYIKQNLIQDTLVLMNINPETRLSEMLTQ